MTEPARVNQGAAAIIARRTNSETTPYEQAREMTGKFYAAFEPEIWPDWRGIASQPWRFFAPTVIAGALHDGTSSPDSIDRFSVRRVSTR